MAKKETEEEKLRRERQERIELLKMKQGIIEESELIPETESKKPVLELHGWEKFKNELYHMKWILPLIVFAVALIVFLIVQTVSRERADLRVLITAFDAQSELGYRLDNIETTLEKYCPDFDGNGKIHVEVVFIDLTSSDLSGQYYSTEADKLAMQFQTGTAQLVISDEGLWDYIYEGGSEKTRYFIDYSEKFPENTLFKECGIRVNATAFAEEAGWKYCPDNVLFFVREELNNGFGNVKKNAESRERAQTVLQNIADNNVINPEN